ncbi:TIGR04002 family protein [Caminicella sporogenes DSM 14501]|uniref:TIGR04002 family protein n=1 Tax=Caminicella sporogenes DSM 14501 TaxID=1121266 RepID=A0A1M6MDY8_9FIRM|nr:ECF transporter S component [Caminicella sporogenes]RKD27588.1 ECF transporter S component [Caminicella sporogenes]WIF94826.1 ECF transporter S component [Caminicella sporogenes]SHJ81692.1 TIGR04002 family protein [Caminicella sporogenes DSM 14501]
MPNVKTRDLTILGLLIALVAVSTMAIQIPVPATEGYIHLGDSMIFLAAVFFGSRYGMIAGGIGSSIADILTGYTHWAIPTLIIKGLMGYIVGKIADNERYDLINLRNIISLIIGALWMVIGYYFGGAVLKGSFLVPLASIPSNLIQGFGGAVLFLPIGIALKKTDIFKKYAHK